MFGKTSSFTNLTSISTKPLTKKTFPKLSGSFAFHAFTDKDGLPQNSAMTILFDQKGYLWVGTQDGATYYNGHKWTTINMPNRQISNSVQTMLSTSDGSLWFGTNGAGLIQLKDSKWTVYDKKSKALANNIVNTLTVTTNSLGQSTIWVGTESGLSSFSNDKWQTYTSESSSLPSDDIETLLVDKDILWIGTNGGGLVKFENNKFSTNYNKTNSLLPSDVVKSLLVTKNNNQKTIWIGTEQGLVSLRENLTNNPQWNIYNTNNSPLPHNIIRCIYPADLQSEKSAIWIGTPAGLAY
ncbi:MAG: two-component regulator propeller domain-containing protein, partial [Blastocatellia bacterium]